MTVALKSRSKKRLPRALPPLQIEQEYYELLQRFVDVTRFALRALISELPRVLDQHATRIDSTGLILNVHPKHSMSHPGEIRLDAGPSKILELAARARAIMTKALTPGRVLPKVGEIASKVAKHGKTQLSKQIEVGLGVSHETATSMIKDETLQKKLAAFAVENAELISGMTSDAVDQIAKIATAALTSGTSTKSVAKLIEKRFDVAKSRAKYIARDQIGKLNGQLTITRHKSIGVKRFTWLDSGDERVRGMPGGRYPSAIPSHHARNGKSYPIDKPPDGEYPGEPMLCRCGAEPDLSTVGE